MLEPDRLKRNASMLQQLHPVFAPRVVTVLADLEGQGLRPRIQEAWRSPQDQAIAYQSGHSKLKFGFHNITGPAGQPRAFAVDILDDDHPAQEGPPYLLHLAAAAQTHQCITGIGWGLPARLQAAVAAAIAASDWAAPVKVGWDPCHVQPSDLTLVQAKALAQTG